MIIPFVGQTYQMEAVSFDNQRSVNLYPLVSETGDSKSVTALRSTPGLSQFATAGDGGIRGAIVSDDRSFFVSGDTLFEVSKLGVSTSRGTLNTSTSIVSIEENPTQIMIIDGLNGYIFNKITNVFAQITDVDFPTPSDLTFQDGYFIVTKADSAQFHISALNDGLTWGALDFTTVESSPDDLVGIISDRSNLWLFGEKTTEIFVNTGATAFPFQRLQGTTIETGCAAAETIIEINNAIYWLGTDENGDSIVWKNAGYQAQRVSTQAIERKLAESSDFTESYAWAYHERGHAFIMFQIKGLDTTLCLDVATNAWHERMFRNTSTADEEQHRGSCHVFFDQKHLVGDRENNKIYQMSLDFFDDDGDPLVKKRISPHIDEEKRLITHAQFELDMEVGVGTVNGQGEDPQIWMQYSDDGGHTWSNKLFRTLGALGNFFTRVKWNKLGKSRDRVYSIEISDPVFVQINEAILNGT